MEHGLSSWHTRSCVLTSYSVGSPGLTFEQAEIIIRLS